MNKEMISLFINKIVSTIKGRILTPKGLFKVAASFFYVLAITFIIIVGGATFLSALKIPGGIRVHTVLSGSMEPSILTGSIIVIKPVETYAVGDIITYKPNIYRDEENSPTSTTHRIMEVRSSDGVDIFVTKGDANDQADVETTDKGLVMGKVFLSIPFIGHLTTYIKTAEGLIILIIIPSVIIIYGEFINIKKEAKKIILAKKTKAKENVEESKLNV